MTRRTLPLALALLVAACRGGERTADAAAGGTLVVVAPTDVDFLLPPLVNGIQGRAVMEQMFERLAEIAPELNVVGDGGFEPRLAERWEWAPDSLSIAFRLNPRARWHDGRPVTARDVRFSWEVYADPATGSSTTPLIPYIDSVQVVDSLTARVWYERRTPEQFYDFAHQIFILPQHVLGGVPHAELKTSAFGRQPVGSGRFRFERWEPNVRLVQLADTVHYRGRPKLDRLVWTVAPDFTASVAKLFAGEADFMDGLRPENVEDIGRRPELRSVAHAALQYGYLQFNLRDPRRPSRPHPIFGDKRVRHALTMALDRPRLAQSVLGPQARVALGPFPAQNVLQGQDSALRQLPFDLARARALLDSAGWRDTNGDSVREKGGRPLEWTLTVPTSSRNRVRYAVLLQEAWRQAGARVNVEQVEQNVQLSRMTSRDFDTFIGVWGTDPSPSSARQTWVGSSARGGGSNYGSYESARFDALVDSAITAPSPARAVTYWKQAYQTIIDDAPAVWLYVPVVTAGMHARLRPVNLRADAWWAGLADWWIPVDERNDRDRVGLRAAAR
ncbi:MAG TPA: peptide ABC transporter substrate-binding protein [Gemmatimonadaceae bacterium]|nr:peptide ABC transporter substrate-binding protein [Gemmatimonadaceae bacterium]